MKFAQSCVHLKWMPNQIVNQTINDSWAIELKKELMAAAQKMETMKMISIFMYSTHCTFRKIKTDVDFIINCRTC